MKKKRTWVEPEFKFHAAGTEEYRRLKALLEEAGWGSAADGRRSGEERSPAGAEQGRD